MGSLSKEKAKRDAEREDKEFPFANFITKRPGDVELLKEFYGIQDEF